MGDQLFRVDSSLLYQFSSDSKGVAALLRANGPCFGTMSGASNQADFLVPDGGEINAHQMQAETNYHDCAARACPAQCIMQGTLRSNRIIHSVIAAEQHFVSKYTFVQLCASQKFYALVCIVGVENVFRTHTGGLLNLERMTRHHTDRRLWSKRAQHL